MSLTLEKLKASHYYVAAIEVLYFLFVVPIGSVLCGLLCIPIICYLLRQILIYIIKDDPQYGKLMNCLECLLFDTDYLSKYPKSTIVSTYTLDSTISYATLYKLWKKNVMEATLPGNPNKPLFAELQQYPTTKWGFYIWKQDPDFQLKNHVREEVLPEHQTLDLAKIHETLINKRYIKGKSPWELILYREKSSDKSCIVALRWIHVMGDAKSLIQVMVDSLAQKPHVVATPKPTPKLPLWKQILFCIYFPVQFFVFYGDQIQKGLNRHITHPWRNSILVSDEAPFALRLTPSIPLEKIKRIAKPLKVMPTSVFVSVLAGITGRLTGMDKTLFGFVQPQDGHPDGLDNYAHVALLEVPTAGMNAVDRTKKCSQAIVDLKNQRQIWCTRFVTIFYGVMWPWLHKAISVQGSMPTGYTNVPGEQEPLMLGNVHRITDHVSTVGTIEGACGIAFCSFSYFGNVRIAVVAKTNVVDEKTLDKICAGLTDELEALQEEVNLAK